ncbi:MAG: thiol peroxidase [Candidatus Brocadiaceae bacterium]|nr:thiol peroxidase [Candidatus Brocadiaceae bacterium]
MLEEHTGLVTMKGDPVVLLGPRLKVGDPAPEFTAVDKNWKEFRLNRSWGNVILISAVPSVDTGVCSVQTKRFNEAAASLPGDVVMLSISQDLPFALTRFCSAEGVERLRVLSDHVTADFGTSYGVLIKGMRLLARSIFVIDREGRLAYMELVPEITEHPDYEAALAALRTLTP